MGEYETEPVPLGVGGIWCTASPDHLRRCEAGQGGSLGHGAAAPASCPSSRSRGAERGQFCRISTGTTGGRKKPGNGIFAPKTARAAARARLRCPLADQTHSKLRNGGDARRRPSPLGGNA